MKQTTTIKLPNSNLIELLQTNCPSLIKSITEFRGDLVATIEKPNIYSFVKQIKELPMLSFNALIDLTAVDFLEQKRDPRFQVVYHLLSLEFGYRLRVISSLNLDDLKVDSLTPLYKSADWYERECYDMYGIEFNAHPNLKRILLYPEFQGYPLRKDYPIALEQPLIELREIEERYDYMINRKD